MTLDPKVQRKRSKYGSKASKYVKFLYNSESWFPPYMGTYRPKGPTVQPQGVAEIVLSRNLMWLWILPLDRELLQDLQDKQGYQSQQD